VNQNDKAASARNHSSPVRTPIAGVARLLIIRFSSFGDIVQALGVPAAFREHLNEQAAEPEVHWLVREDFRGLLVNHPAIERVIAFPRDAGLMGLLKTSWRLAGQDYTHVYDAHNNLRSHLVSWVFAARGLVGRLQGRRPPLFLRRSKDRFRRWLFFRFRLKTLPEPFKGAESFLRPLSPWGIPLTMPKAPLFVSTTELPAAVTDQLKALRRPLVALAPSAAWEMKRWPISHWRELMRLLPGVSFALLGGPDDHFLKDLESAAPERTINLAGRLSLAQSAALIREADLTIANDTGLLHVADQMGRPTLALIGPTAFGYTSQPNSTVLEIKLPCKPCSKDGRGGCVNSLYQRCLVELSPQRVADAAQARLYPGIKTESKGL
jgi:ADP-heptose:LPS heptosyltransferase